MTEAAKVVPDSTASTVEPFFHEEVECRVCHYWHNPPDVITCGNPDCPTRHPGTS
mgnify:CR=1 FL=1